MIRKALLAVAGLFVASESSGVETPSYEVVAVFPTFEVRDYAPTVEARTAVRGNDEMSRSAGFRVLAGYIFGGNRSGDEIAMTAPVQQFPSDDGSWRVTFTMPSGHDLASLPTPSSDRVALVQVPARRVAAVRFSGAVGSAEMARKAEALTAALASEGLAATGPAVFAWYDPPWTPGPFRRNEVLIPLAEPTADRTAAAAD